MSPAHVTWRRTIGRLRNLYASALTVGGFLAAVAFTLSANLEAAEGTRISLAAVWATSVSPWLPVLSALLAMDSWSDERQSGRIDMLLSAPVRERSLVWGKFIGVWSVAMFVTLVALALSILALLYFAPTALAGMSIVGWLPALAALAMQSALWCALSVATSVLCHHPALSAVLSLALTVALPRGVWMALLALSPSGRTAYGEFPLDAHVLDIALGSLSLGTVLPYLLLTGLSLFFAVKRVASLRFVGKGSLKVRLSTQVAVGLAAVFTALAILLSIRLDASVDIAGFSVAKGISARTRKILSETEGEIVISVFLPRNDSRFRQAGRLLRAIKRESASVGGARIEPRFVDPRWDLGAAERLIRLGAVDESIVFEKGRRHTVLALSKDAFDERTCASTIRMLTTPRQRNRVYWTAGHGEFAFDEYGPWGMSDIARELSRGGYRNEKLDLSADMAMPADCALIVIAGAKNDFSRIEQGRIDEYLKHGGRLLVLANLAEQGGVTALLSAWGIRPVARAFAGQRTLSGSDVIVSEFTDHAIVSALNGSQIVLDRPLAFESSAAAETGSGVDRIGFAPLARVGGASVAAVVERGSGMGRDLSLRPTRIVAIGDASFVMNGQLASRANANRDFFLNCVAYLAGTDAIGADGSSVDLLATRMDRGLRTRFTLASVVGLPAAVTLLMCMTIAIRRRRR